MVVEKRRRLLVWDGVRIHLDEVEGLGSFLELEAVAGPDSDLEPERAKVERLRAELGIEDDARAPSSYSDLLLERSRAAARAPPRRRCATPTRPTPTSRWAPPCARRRARSTRGANVENASYPQGQCAEASALGALVAAGEREIAAVAVVAEKREICPPCGGCRQRLAELAGPETPVYLGPAGRPAARPPAWASCCR